MNDREAQWARWLAEKPERRTTVRPATNWSRRLLRRAAFPFLAFALVLRLGDAIWLGR